MPGRCFVAMAFDRKDTDSVYDRLIAPVVRRVGMTPVRIDCKEHNRNINEVIVDELKSADLVIADLTYARPSVYFEAGFAERVAPRRYTRSSNGFSRKIENHMAAVSLNYFSYNFCKIHRTLRVTPAMAAGVVTKLMDMSDLVAMLEESEKKAA